MKLQKMALLPAILMALGLALPGLAQSGNPVQLSFEGELGAVKVLTNSYRVGTTPANSDFSFVSQGGEEILSPFERLTTIVTIADRHELRFLYQPLQLDTEVKFRTDITVDDVLFPAGTAMRLSYGFPFYRATYQYRFLDRQGSWLAGGAALQLRNASIKFESLDGSKLTVSQNLGLVPALALSGRLNLGAGLYTAFDATGIYASSAFFNGANFEFTGSILDASLRLGTALRDVGDYYVNLRFIGGTADGTSQYAQAEWTNSVSRTTSNHLATVSLTLGAAIR